MDAVGALVARHEADHAAALAAFGWPVRGVRRDRGLSGETQIGVRTDGDVLSRAFELSVVLLAPSLHDATGADADLRRLSELVAMTDRLRMSEIFDATERLVADPVYVRRRRAIERALWSRLSLSASEAAELLA